MFPIFSTVLAVILCLIGLDMSEEAKEGILSPFALLPLSIIPLGELLIWTAKKRSASFGPKGLKLLRLFFFAYPLLMFSAALFGFGLNFLPQQLGLDRIILLDKLVLLVSYLIISNLTRFYRKRFSQALTEPAQGYPQISLTLAIKGELTIMLPFMAFVLFNDLISLHDGVSSLFNYIPLLFWCCLFVLFLSLAFAMPEFIRVLWSLKPLPISSPQREELYRFMEKQNFQVKDILVWPTGDRLVNAAILGLAPKYRYIIFTDAILKKLSLSELKAVLAHELGHGKQRHLLIYLVFSIAFIFGISFLENLISPMETTGQQLKSMLLWFAPAVLLYWWLVFGFLSRRFEMEADIFGAWAVGDPKLFIQTLDKVALMGRVEKQRGSWRHFSIERRMASLRKIFYENPGIATRFGQRMIWIRRLLLWVSLVFFLVFLGGMAVDTLAGIGLLALERDHYETARVYLEKASELPGGAVYSWPMIDVHLKSNQLDRAARLLRDLTSSMSGGSANEKISSYFVKLAMALLSKGRHDPCLNLLDRALELFPHDMEIKELKGAVLLYVNGNPVPLQHWIHAKKGQGTREKERDWFLGAPPKDLEEIR